MERLTQRDVDEYRTARLKETTKRGGPPAPATLDHEVALLKRVLNYAKRCGDVKHNPVLGIALLRVPNVRRTVVTEAQFAKLLDVAEEPLRSILIVAYEMGMRKQEVLQLQWNQVDIGAGTVRLAPQDTKGGEHRVVYMTARVKAAFKAMVPKEEDSKTPHVFLNPDTKKAWVDIRKPFQRALEAAGLPSDVWVRDLRRSFVTNARRRGIPESVVMRMSGHRTRSVFDRYNVVDEADLKNAAAALEAGAAREFGQETVKVGGNAA